MIGIFESKTLVTETKRKITPVKKTLYKYHFNAFSTQH